jgi:RHS repeat-associated protein
VCRDGQIAGRNAPFCGCGIFQGGSGERASYWDIGEAPTPSLARVAARYEYDAFGNVVGPDPDHDGDWLEHAGPFATANPFRFSTKYWDDERLGYWGYRYYLAPLGRWLNPDPLGEAGGLNLYGYGNNSPISNVDALGHCPACRACTWVLCGTWPDPRNDHGHIIGGSLCAFGQGSIEGANAGTLTVACALTLGQDEALNQQRLRTWREICLENTACERASTLFAGTGAGCFHAAGALCGADIFGISELGSVSLAALPSQACVELTVFGATGSVFGYQPMFCPERSVCARTLATCDRLLTWNPRCATTPQFIEDARLDPALLQQARLRACQEADFYRREALDVAELTGTRAPTRVAVCVVVRPDLPSFPGSSLGNKLCNQPTVIAEQLGCRLPPESLMPYYVTNCAEFGAQNSACLATDCFVGQCERACVDTQTGAPVPPCENCAFWQ